MIPSSMGARFDGYIYSSVMVINRTSYDIRFDGCLYRSVLKIQGQ